MERADAAGDREFVVVEDDDQRRVHVTGVVQRLPREAAGQRAVADHGDGVPVRLALELVRDGEAECGGDRGAGVARAEGVVLALLALEEAADAARLLQRREAVPPPGENLVCVRLMPDIPDDRLARGIEGGEQGDGHLDDAEVG